jgi:hypothetical protein
MTLQHPFELPLSRFSFDRGELTAEASDFGSMNQLVRNDVPAPAFIRRLYDDACDLGIAIRSERTGRIARFYWCEGEGRNADYSWGYDRFVFRPEMTRGGVPCVPVAKVTIFND